MRKKLFLYLIIYLNFFSFAQKSDLIVFSYKRPLQLYSFLESATKYINNLNALYIIYRADDEIYYQAYQEVKNNFSDFIYIKQEISKETNNFRELVLAILKNNSSDYILFAVDDIIVKDYIDLSESVDYLEKNHAYGFYLKMGTHLTECYSHKSTTDPKAHLQPLPPINLIDKDIYSWNFSEGVKDWNYPNSVDMVLYRKKDILPVLESFDFTGPNMLEDYWARKFPENKKGLFYELSKVVNIPINVVQDYWPNNNLKLYTTQELLNIFESGLKIDINPLFRVLNNDVHWNYNFNFIKR